jgi:hypothetical protein
MIELKTLLFPSLVTVDWFRDKCFFYPRSAYRFSRRDNSGFDDNISLS